MTKPAAITDADRLAATNLLIGGKVAGGDGGTYYLKTPSIQDAERAFAAHRIQAREEAIEEAAKLCDMLAAKFREADDYEENLCADGAECAADVVRKALAVD